jgi:Cu(I)/Ag(I) efflux system membrane fusion protein
MTVARKSWIALVAAAVALLMLGYYAGLRQAPPAVAVVAQPAAAERPVLYWYDPMKPDQHFDKPGKSPYMDMDLLPRHADDAPATAGVQVAATVQHNLGLKLARVEHIALASRVEASGLLTFNERDVAVVQVRAAGFVERAWPLAAGDRVQAGDPLVQLRIPEWTAAQYEYLALRSAGDASLVAVARERLQLLGQDEAQIRALETRGVAQGDFLLRAPISGVLQSLDLRNGMSVMAGQAVARINGLATVWLEVAVPESQAAAVQVGDSASVQLVAAPTVVVTGRVEAVLPALNEMTRTARVRIQLPNRKGQLRPGQSAQVTLTAAAGEPALSVPTEAVIRTGKRSLVMVAQGDRYVATVVTLGAEVGGRTIIDTGLRAGQQVVASGQFLLDSEASVRGLAP